MIAWIISSSVLIAVVLMLRFALKGRISARLRYALWALVLVRLLLPWNLGQTDFSVMNRAGQTALIRNAEVIQGVSMIEHTQNGAVIGSGQYEIMPDAPTVVIPDVSEEDFSQMKTLISLRDILNPIWKIGIFVMLAVFAFSNSHFQSGLKNTRKRLDMPACPLPVYTSGSVETPCLFGLFQPAIYLPPTISADQEVLHHALTHELTHFYHRDHVWAYLRCLCLSIHWYNPLVWLAALLSRRDSELACDEGTIRRLGEAERIRYGKTLLALTCERHGPGSFFQTATTMTGSKNSLRERISFIARRPRQLWIATLAVVLAAALTAACTFTGAGGEESGKQDPDAAEPSTLSQPETGESADVDTPESGEFPELFGFSGHWAQMEQSPHHYGFSYYLHLDSGDVCVAESFGFERDDYIQDVDGDGVSELICNVVYGADGAERVRIFRRVGDDIQQGWLDWETLEIAQDAWQMAGANQLSERYDGEGSLLITYPKEDSSAVDKVPLSMEQFVFEPYVSLAHALPIGASDTGILEHQPNTGIYIAFGLTHSKGYYLYRAPDDQAGWIAAWETAMESIDYDAEYNLPGQTGLMVCYEDRWLRLMDSGTLNGIGGGVIPAAAAKPLYDMTMELARASGWSEAVQPEDISSIVSATIDWNGTHARTDAYALGQIETWLSGSKELMGGAGCPFTSLLTLELADGRSLELLMGTDSCTTWMSNGVYYQYPAGGNQAFFALFAPEAIHAAAESGDMEHLQWMLDYLNWSEYAKTFPGGPDTPDPTLELMDQLHTWAAEINLFSEEVRKERFRIFMTCTEGLDGAYADYYANLLYRLYQQDPVSFARVATENLWEEPQTETIIWYLAYHTDRTTADIQAELERVLQAGET